MEPVVQEVAKGEWQKDIARYLLTGQKVHNPIALLAGRASGFTSKYTTSLDSLIRRLVDAGYIVYKELGPRGGSWSCNYSVVKSEGVGSFVCVAADGRRFAFDRTRPVWNIAWFSPATTNLDDCIRLCRKEHINQ